MESETHVDLELTSFESVRKAYTWAITLSDDFEGELRIKVRGKERHMFVNALWYLLRVLERTPKMK